MKEPIAVSPVLQWPLEVTATSGQLPEHTYPPGEDPADHRDGIDCPCAPACWWTPDGPTVIAHNTFDGRDAWEATPAAGDPC